MWAYTEIYFLNNIVDGQDYKDWKNEKIQKDMNIGRSKVEEVKK